MSCSNDLQVKDCIKTPKYFCDLYNGAVFSEKQILNPEDIRPLPTETSIALKKESKKSEYLGRFHDVVYETNLGNKYVILPVENQKHIHLAMSV